MACSSGTSSGSSGLIRNSSSEEDLQQIMDQRKRKRMLSNRESARRSRMRKQKHLDDLVTQVSQLRIENNQILTNMNITTELFLNVEAENSILRAQMAELSQRLQSLNEIIGFMNFNNEVFESDHHGLKDDDQFVHQIGGESWTVNPWSFLFLNHQPVVASGEVIMY